MQRERTINERQELLKSEERTSASLKQQIEDMKKELEDKEAVHQQRYLDMYQKVGTKFRSILLSFQL